MLREIMNKWRTTETSGSNNKTKPAKENTNANSSQLLNASRLSESRSWNKAPAAQEPSGNWPTHIWWAIRCDCVGNWRGNLCGSAAQRGWLCLNGPLIDCGLVFFEPSCAASHASKTRGPETIGSQKSHARTFIVKFGLTAALRWLYWRVTAGNTFNRRGFKKNDKWAAGEGSAPPLCQK